MSDTPQPHIPQRVQMSRQYSWRVEHPDVVIVDRRGDFDNPYRVGRSRRTMGVPWSVWFFDGEGLKQEIGVYRTRNAALADSVRAFAVFLDEWKQIEKEQYTAFMVQLAGRDLACWCKLWDETRSCRVCDGLGFRYDEVEEGGVMCDACEGTGYARNPCHADVLLMMANPKISFLWAGCYR